MITILFPKEVHGLTVPSLGNIYPLQAWAEENIRAVEIYTDRNNRIACNVMDSCGKIIGPIVGRGQEDDFSIYHGTLHSRDLNGYRASIGEAMQTPYFLLCKDSEKLLELWGF